MKITFLGTGPAINIPRKGCGCLTCKDARKLGSKSRRTNSSVLIQNEGTNVLIDCTPNFLKQITPSNSPLHKGENVGVTAVFLTHAHKDASGGLRDLFKFAKKQKNQITLYVHKETLRKLKPKTKDQKQKTNIKNIKIKFIRPFQTIRLLNFKIVSFPVFHGLKKYPTFGYLINDKIIYASDMDGAPKKSLKYFKRAKTLVLDASMWFGKKIKGHFNAEQAIEFARGMKTGTLYLTHIGHTFPPHKKAAQEIKKYLKQKQVPLQVELAYDGMKIKI